MQQVDAIFEDGVFKPVGPVVLEEKQRVRLNIEPVRNTSPEAAKAWMERARAMRQRHFQKYGQHLPDSTPDIAEDRMRDV